MSMSVFPRRRDFPENLKLNSRKQLGTLRNENRDGDGDPKTRKKTGEITPLGREFPLMMSERSS